ncbi:hypothetical protein [Luteolibacter marinus]|uniref:hypothetical protein n=1 Tax=Luteolibacter marinus TaxID=2776705 RepID=UPI0018663066|nr:hypothetical protein [Luteolibacter marinus]
MKTRPLTGALCLVAATAIAQTTENYPDATGEVAVGTFPHLDLTSVDVTVDATETNITFILHLAGSPVATDWGKYAIGLRSNPGGATTGNGWGRPIHFAGGMTHWIACWVDGGNGGQVHHYTGSWAETDSPVVTKDATSVSITTTTAALGLSPGEVFSFDVYSTGGGGGDGAVDALSAAASSINNWGDAYTTAVAGGESNAALTFTMPGTADFATWIAGFGLAGNDALPETDYDDDGLTNQEEFDLDLGLSPVNDDSDDDFLKDGWENLTGTYVDGTHTGTSPMAFDTDGDGISDGDEVDGVGLDFPQDPNHFNHVTIVVPGSFNLPDAWDPAGISTPGNAMSLAGTGFAEQFQWSLDYHFTTPKTTITHKFTAGSWTTNWGASGTAGVAAPNGGDINRLVEASGIHRITFNSITLAHTFARATFADANAYLAAYGLAAGADEDNDNVLNEDEFAANTDPRNADSDGDGLQDDVDPEPLVAAPESRDIVFQVDMSVAIGDGYFTAGVSTVRVIGQFDGPWNVAGGVVLADPDEDMIYTGTFTAEGFEGSPFGVYKFFIDGGPNSGYEDTPDRTVNLGPDGVEQVLPVVYYANIGPPAGFDAWIAGFEGLSDLSREGDPDGDGISSGDEFLFGTSPASGTGRAVMSAPGPTGLTLVWLQRTTGATYVLEENDDLAGDWTPGPVLPAVAPDQAGVPADYTRMEALIPFGIRNFVRVTGSEN